MTARRFLSVLSIAAALSACASGRGRDRQPTDLEITPTGYCEVLGADGLVDWSGRAATLCPGLVAEPTEHDGLAGEGCTVYTVDANGGMVPTEITGARSAQALTDGRFVVWGWDGSLSIRDARGSSTEVAPLALDPWVDAASGKIAFIGPVAGAESLEPGDDREVILYDIPSGASQALITDASAAGPVPIPGTEDVLYVSSAAGVASIVRVTPTETLTLTNRDATGVEQEFVPVYGRQLLFTEGATGIVFTAEYESDVLWTLNLTTGEAVELGPGRFPAFGSDGSVLAAAGSGESCALHYLDGRTP